MEVLKYENIAVCRSPSSTSIGECSLKSNRGELRAKGRSGIGRAFYCFLAGQRVLILHAFIKKSQQTPDQELKLARKRMKEVFHG